MDEPKGRWENKLSVACQQCGQYLRIPIAYNPLQVTCPKCRKSFLYDYIQAVGLEAEYPVELQMESVLVIGGLVFIYLLSFIIFVAALIENNFQDAGPLPFPVSLLIFIIAGFFIVRLIDYKTFKKYRSARLLVINRQGIIYFDKQLRAMECLNWGDIRSVKYFYARHMFAGLIETKREPAYIELEVQGKGKVILPPDRFFSRQQRMRIMGEILARYQPSGSFSKR